MADFNAILQWVVAIAILGYLFFPIAITAIKNTKENVKKLKEVLK